MISHKKAVEAAKTIAEYCKQHKDKENCQNCIFCGKIEFYWGCQIQGLKDFAEWYTKH